MCDQNQENSFRKMAYRYGSVILFLLGTTGAVLSVSGLA